MNEFDKEWLGKNNEGAHREGTSAQGAISLSDHSQCSSKARGKEPDLSPPVVKSRDKFKLMMAVFEKVTHEKIEYIYCALEHGAEFPTLTDYQDTFSAPLPPSTLADFITLSWLAMPTYLLCFVRVIYPHWCERCLEIGGKRTMPTINVCLSPLNFLPFSNTSLAQ